MSFHCKGMYHQHSLVCMTFVIIILLLKVPTCRQRQASLRNMHHSTWRCGHQVLISTRLDSKRKDVFLTIRRFFSFFITHTNLICGKLHKMKNNLDNFVIIEKFFFFHFSLRDGFILIIDAAKIHCILNQRHCR